MRDPDIPFCFLWVFNSFLEIFNHSGETVTFTDIKDWAFVRKIELKQKEIDLILDCIGWANTQIKKMRDEEDTDAEADEGQTT